MQRTPPDGLSHATAHRQHICLVTETYPPEVNGVALTLAHLVTGLRAQGYTASVVRPRRQTSDGSGCSNDSTVTLVRGLPLPGSWGLQFGLPAGGLLRRAWTQQRPDVVYVATEGPLGWSAVRVARRLGIPVFSGFHTNFHSYSRYYRAGWLQSLAFHCLRSFHNRTAGTLVPSVDLRDRLHALGFKDVRVLGRGVDSQLFTPDHRCTALRRQWGVSENDLVVLYVGRLAPEKNLGLAIGAYRAMQRVSDSLKFVLVGDGPLGGALQRAHADFIFCGLRTGEELARHYASADVFLFPSETETFGNVTLEAMASGLAVIAYDYAAAKMHITHGETGILVPYGDTQAFVDSAAQLVRGPQALHMMRRQAREYVAACDWQRIVERFATLLTGGGATVSVASFAGGMPALPGGC
ncbi:MAG: glycosyltransferase family 4 protein [Candidatus Binatia bacterium]